MGDQDEFGWSQYGGARSMFRRSVDRQFFKGMTWTSFFLPRNSTSEGTDSLPWANNEQDTTVRVWHKDTGLPYRTLSGHRGPVNAVQLFDNKVISASGDAIMKLWDVLTGEVLRSYKEHSRGIACAQVSPSRKLIVTGGNDQLIKVWDAETGVCLTTLVGHTDLVRTIAFDEERRRIVSGSYDKTLRLWDLDSGEQLLCFKAHSSLVFDVSMSVSKLVRLVPLWALFLLCGIGKLIDVLLQL